MIRFIDLRGQIDLDRCNQCFAFYDTVVEQFVTFSSNQIWETVADFTADYKGHNLQRFLNLIPKDFR
jgi:hypothetical protein